MAEVQGRVRDMRNLGFQAAQYDANPQRRPAQAHPASDGLDKAKARALGTCQYRAANQECPYSGRCKFVCYESEPPDEPPDRPKRYR